MNRLILLRHAKAERRSASGQDIDRALTDGGRADAALMGRVLADQGLRPDVVLVSAARRTQETWDAMADLFPRARTQVMRALYNASPLVLFEAAEGAGAGTVLVIAHNPGVHELALRLLIEAGAGSRAISRAGGRFSPATAAAFLIDEGGRPSYDGLFYVADHGGGGEE